MIGNYTKLTIYDGKLVHRSEKKHNFSFILVVVIVFFVIQAALVYAYTSGVFEPQKRTVPTPVPDIRISPTLEPSPTVSEGSPSGDILPSEELSPIPDGSTTSGEINVTL